MHILQDIIGSLNKEDKRNFKLFLRRTNNHSDRKDEKLFDYINKNFPDYNEEEVQQNLYNSKNKNSLYQLKNRLISELKKSVVVQYFEEVGFNEILYHIALSRLFFKKNQYNVCFFFFEKAENSALKNEYYEILDLIYSELIRLSQESLDINPEAYIKKRNENKTKIGRIQQVDDLLAVLIYRIKTTQLLSHKKDTKILNILQRTANDFIKDKMLQQSPALRLRIYFAISKILLQREDYTSLESYLIKTFNEFSRKNFFNKNNHDTKLQMITYIVNSAFRNQKINLSLEYTNQLREAMKEFNNLFYDKYLFYYYNSLIINYSVINKDKAIEVLNEAKENAVINKTPLHIALIYHNLSVTYFDKKDFRSALKNLLRHINHHSFAKLDEGFKLKVHIAELIIRFELIDYEYIERLIKNIKKEFGKLAKEDNYKRDFDLMKLILIMCKHSTMKENKQIAEKIKLYIQHYSNTKANDVINYTNWLNSKV